MSARCLSVLTLFFAAAGALFAREPLAAIEAARPGALNLEARVALGGGEPPAWLAPADEDGRRRWWIEAAAGWSPPAEWTARRRWSKGRRWILELDPAELARLAADAPLLSIRPDRRLRPCLDLALPLCAADLAQQAPEGPWRGAGVVVGVVDSGFDPQHGDFRAGGRSRVLALWDQLDGRVYTRGEIEAGQADLRDPVGHGTHVCGIAAGNGLSAGATPSGGPFVGFAPEADLAVVASTLTESDILAGVQWIFEQADEAGRPCVVNLSLETHLGPHDGDSDFEDELEALCGPGRLLVVAAGNSGDGALHHHANFGRSHAADFASSAADEIFLDAWIDSPSQPTARLRLPDGTVTEALSGPRRLSGWTVTFPAPHQEQGRWRLLLRLESGRAGDAFRLELNFGDDLQRGVEAWAYGLDFDEPALEHTVGIPATGDSMFVAGSLVHRRSWTAADGSRWGYPDETEGEASSFSALGPRIDGRRVPQVLLPGQGVFAALSRGFALTADLDPWRHEDGQHVLRQGTSMAAPALAGCLALALGKDPLLSSAGADSLLRIAAGDPWEPKRGHGLLDVQRLLALVAQGLRELQVEPGLDAIRIGWSLGADWPDGLQRIFRQEVGRADTLLAELPALAGAASVVDGTLGVGRVVRYRVELLDGEGRLASRLTSDETALRVALRPAWTALGPNPVEDGRLRLAWLLPAEAELRWSLHDLLGRRLGEGSLGRWPRGSAEAWIALPPSAAGLQILRLESGDWKEARRILRLDGARP